MVYDFEYKSAHMRQYNIRLLNHLLWDLSRNINQTFNFMLALKLLPDFIFLAHNIYFGLYKSFSFFIDLNTVSLVIFPFIVWMFGIVYFTAKILTTFEKIENIRFEAAACVEDIVMYTKIKI